MTEIVSDEALSDKTHDGYYMEYRPTIAQRIWRKLVFRYYHGEEPEDIEDFNGWMRTDMRMQFGFLDRLRLLLTGCLHIQLVQHTPVQCDYSKNRIDWCIGPLGDR